MEAKMRPFGRILTYMSLTKYYQYFERTTC